MRKIALLMVVMLTGVFAIAQTRTVSGTVRDKDGHPVEGASVVVKGTSTGTAASADGSFKLSVKPGDILMISAVNFESYEIPVENNSSLAISLKRSEALINEVVVTALGVKRNKNTLPYAAQQVSGDDIARTRSGNAASSLSGKVSGLEIRQGNGIGGSTNVVIRGTKSLLGNNQALFVVDGVPVDNSNTNTDGSADPARNQKGGRGGYDYGNSAADINPDDIESLNVLKGAAASALYGSRAANGVIMITTKKGRKGLGVTINSGVTVGTIDKSTFATYQKQYGAGYATSGYGAPDPNGGFFYFDVNGDGEKDLVVPTTEDASYGQRFDPNLMVYHWDAFDKSSPYYQKAKPWVAAQNDPSHFYETAVSTNNNITFDGGNDKGTFKLGYTRNDEKGILPNSQVLKNLVNFGATYNITSKLTAAASINFSKIDGRGRYGTGYDDWNVNQNFRQWYQTNMDVLDQKAAYFRTKQNITWNWADPSTAAGLVPIYTDNPYWTRYENYENDSRSRYFGAVSLNYKATDWLSFLGRVSLDSYDEIQEERSAVGSVSPASYGRYNRSFREYNYDFMANFDKNLTKDFNLKALAGVNIRQTTISSISAITNGGLIVPGLYTLANSLNPIAAPVEYYAPEEVDGYFTGATLTYREFLSLDATYRRDRSSTLPLSNNTYGYPSVSASWFFSKNLASLNWLSYGKLRANYAEVGNSAPWGSTSDIYDKPSPFETGVLFSLPGRKNNNNLVPERTYSKEIGLEMAFLKSRVGFDVSYYHTNSRNQIMPVAVSTATGYSSKYVNSGDIENKGVELSVFATPVKTRNFSWNINVNWTRNRNKVLDLYEESSNLLLASFQGGVTVNATKGQPYGTIQGKTWQTLDGERLINTSVPQYLSNGDLNPAYGRYAITSTTNNVIGNINPDWIGGVYNTFKYKNFSLGFLVDVRQGGDVFSLDLYYGMATGIYPETVLKNDLGNDSRLPISEGGGVIMPGVTTDGKANTIRVENIYGTYGYAYNPAANFVYDASFVKLREMNFTYTVPGSLLAKTKVIKGIDLSLIGRNLWIIHKNLPYSDPEENLSSGNAQGYQSGAYPTTRSMGFNVKVKF